MENLVEESLPRIKPQFTLDSDVDKAELNRWLIDEEADGKRPSITRTGTITAVAGKDDNRYYVIELYNEYFYMFNEEAPKAVQEAPRPIGMKVQFKISGRYQDKIIVSNKAIKEYYMKALASSKIMQGRIIDVKDGAKTYSKYAIVMSKGDTILIPSSQFAYPSVIPIDKLIGHLISFVVIDVNEKGVIASSKVVSQYHESQLNHFYKTGESFRAKVESVNHFGATLTYKNNCSLLLRNRDFSSNYTSCKDILAVGDTIYVKLKEISRSNKYIVEMVQKYNAAPALEYDDIKPQQQFEGEVVRVDAFGAFVRIAVGRDVLCPINFDKREPVIGNKVQIEIVVSNAELGRLRGKILKYKDEIPDLSEFNLKGDNYGY